ncbi:MULTISPECIES: UDP-glucose/GDP-mannose dehydrogenase family protein [unclassified Beijerinckia]|uniref:UDP-glucose dehydrogenase family protein n=1 Tax=unclassified Beijerinckia TaxID=2638183 RepID=UPI00089CE391|nr:MULTISPECIES: UDP-glucose/GDP-mannose dehydrogenase family protein [unclassified Beijerinckia]MDH7796678.1 UDPglucose 6-dehydrogenase [Beijerinckia sp. GAS462]SEC55352.1 UDP-glucose dehydrogenase [Beijerinckia sp. 28-YEA-48]
MRIAMIGAGYVGLVSGACFADFGHTVVCVDKDAGRIAALEGGEMPIFEPGLAELVASNVQQHRLSFTTSLGPAVAAADVVFIAVGTSSPQGDGQSDNGSADLADVYAAAAEIADAISGFTVIATYSTVPVGTGDEVARIIRERRPEADFSVASNPKFLHKGTAIADFNQPGQIIIGTDDLKARDALTEIYRPLHLDQPPLMFMDRRTAELTKYAANAFLATKIAFINEIADLCEKTGANVQDVARAISLDNRVGSDVLHAGPGYGGSSLSKDAMALIRTGHAFGTPVRIVETVAAANAARKQRMAEKILDACGGSVLGRTLAVLGLAFKPNTDDMREAPALTILPALQQRGAAIRAYDPAAMTQARPLLPGVTFCEDAYECAKGADALVILTEWDAFRALDLTRLRGLLAKPIMVDLRNVYRPEDMRKHGFDYTSIGRA